MIKKRYFVLLATTLILSLACSGCSGSTQTTSSSVPTSSTQGTSSATNTAKATTIATPKVTNSSNCEWKTFTSEKHQFTINYPSTWVVIDPSAAYGAVFRPSKETQTTFYVEIYHSNYSDQTQKGYVDEMIKYVKRIRDDCTYEAPYATTINGYSFTTMKYQGTANGVTYYYTSNYAANGYGYIVRYVITAEDLAAIEPIAKEMAASFKFTK